MTHKATQTAAAQTTQTTTSTKEENTMQTTRDENRENFEYCRHIVDTLEALHAGRATDNDSEDDDPADLYDYFDDVLDLSYIINSDLSYSGVKVYVTLGGPTCWIDTDKSAVCLTWGGKSAECYFSYDLRDAIDEIFEEYYNAQRGA